jgi:hypothetical protein
MLDDVSRCCFSLFVVFLLTCYFGHLKLIEPAILHLLLGDVLADDCDDCGIPATVSTRHPRAELNPLRDNTLRVWDLATGETQKCMQTSNGWLAASSPPAPQASALEFLEFPEKSLSAVGRSIRGWINPIVGHRKQHQALCQLMDGPRVIGRYRTNMLKRIRGNNRYSVR